MRYGPPGEALPSINDNEPSRRPDLHQEQAEASANLMSQGSEKPVLLPADAEDSDGSEQETTVRARSRDSSTSRETRAPGAVFFFVAES